MKTAFKNITTIEEAINQHILDCVYSETYYKYGKLEDAKNRLKNDFERETNHEYYIRRIPNDQSRFQHYLKCIPFNFYFECHKINKFLNSLGLNPEGIEYTVEESYKLYSYLIFKQMYSNVKHE